MVNWWKQEKRGAVVVISWQKKHARVYSFFNKIEERKLSQNCFKTKRAAQMVLPTFPLWLDLGSKLCFLFELLLKLFRHGSPFFFFLYSLFFLSLTFAYDSIWPGLPFCGKLNSIASNNINCFYFSASPSWANSFPVWSKSNATCTPCVMETLSTW